MNLERLFRQIVLNLAAKDPGGLRRPLSLAEIRDGVLPYRINRQTLGIDTSEDYELALLRLYAGESGLARTAPAEARIDFAAELNRPQPDLAILQQYETATILLDPAAVDRILDPEPDLRFAPKKPASSPGPDPRKGDRSKPDTRIAHDTISGCNRCSATLPSDRIVNFCPQCGQNLAIRHCAECGSKLEVSWKHCVACGVSVAPNPRTGTDR